MAPTKNCWDPAEELIGFLCDPAELPSAVLFCRFLSSVHFSAGCCRDVTPSSAYDALSCFGTHDSVIRNGKQNNKIYFNCERSWKTN